MRQKFRHVPFKGEYPRVRSIGTAPDIIPARFVGQCVDASDQCSACGFGDLVRTDQCGFPAQHAEFAATARYRHPAVGDQRFHIGNHVR